MCVSDRHTSLLFIYSQTPPYHSNFYIIIYSKLVISYLFTHKYHNTLLSLLTMKKFVLYLLLCLAVIVAMLSILGAAYSVLFVYSITDLLIGGALTMNSLHETLVCFFMYLASISFFLISCRSVYLFYSIIIKGRGKNKRS